jgi:hypothetical protein
MIESTTDIGNLMTRLQDWFQEQCDGDWEHSYGLVIETLDNPGWMVTIDLADTAWEKCRVSLVRDAKSENDWLQYEVREGKFIGCGAVQNLADILACFFRCIGR